MNGAQAAGCSPVATAYAAGQDVCRPVKPDTIAKSLAIGNPADGPYALDLARRTGGGIDAVTDDEIKAGIRLLAETTGIFTETAGGVTTAVLAKLAERGDIDPDERVVAIITGEGLKTLDVVRGTFETIEIEASCEAFEAHVRDARSPPDGDRREDPDPAARRDRRRRQHIGRRRAPSARCSTRSTSSSASCASGSPTTAACAASSTSTSAARTSASSTVSTRAVVGRRRGDDPARRRRRLSDREGDRA